MKEQTINRLCHTTDINEIISCKESINIFMEILRQFECFIEYRREIGMYLDTDQLKLVDKVGDYNV